jgi:hypothetical protein
MLFLPRNNVGFEIIYYSQAVSGASRCSSTVTLCTVVSVYGTYCQAAQTPCCTEVWRDVLDYGYYYYYYSQLHLDTLL